MAASVDSEPGGPRDLGVVQRLEVTDVAVRFGGVRVLDGVSLVVEPGEIVGLIGPNGAGKSTLIDAICGFVPVRSGRIRLGSRDLTGTPVHTRIRAGLGRSWQGIEVFDDMSVRENLQVAGRRTGLLGTARDLLGIDSRHPVPIDGGIAAAFGLAGDLDRLPTELSFSQRRLVNIARAVALAPSILLLDEPAAGLSDGRRKGLAAVLRGLARDRGIGLLLVEHDMPFVMGLSDRIVALNLGCKISDGTPDEVRANPAVRASYLRGTEDDQDTDTEPAAAGEAQESDRPILVVPETEHERRASTHPRAVDDAETVLDRAPVPLLTAKGLAVGYNGRPVVQGIDLELHEGKVIALLGANRSGKTTTLLGLAGAVPALAGEVSWLGGTVTKRVPLNKLAEQGLAMLTEGRSVFRDLTVTENLRVGQCDVEHAISLFPELDRLRKRRVGLLSGGEQQMVGLCRALARRPKVLLVDEMSLGLAPRMVTRLMDSLRKAADELDVGVILVEQHVPQALRIADHVCVVAGGRMNLSGSVQEVGHRVDEAFLADVLGSPVAQS